MKILKLSLLLAVCISVSGCTTTQRPGVTAKRSSASTAIPKSAGVQVKLLRITASVDGSGRMIFTGGSVRYEHKFWTPPWNVTLNGEAWSDLATPPTGWSALASQLDLTRARIVTRSGRDVIALEPTAEGFDLYLNDTPNGAADYEATIAIPRRK